VSDRRRTARDERRRRLGQNFLRPEVAHAFVEEGNFLADQLVIEIGAGRGSCTFALAALGVEVVAVEKDVHFAAALRRDVRRRGLTNVKVVEGDVLGAGVSLGRLAGGRPFRVLSSLPFGATTSVLRLLFDDPASSSAPWRADLVVQLEVARKRAAIPPTTLLSTTWVPWWRFDLGRRIPATAFRPVPAVDAAVLAVTRRTTPLLPTRLAKPYASFVRQAWQ
jgi:23S rRNA (adenine-N6)-dimethyltransferase